MTKTYLFSAFLILLTLTGNAQGFSVYFRTDKSNIEPEAQLLLDSLVAAGVFSANDSLAITCHCDVRADSAYNYALSMRRAKSVQHYLKKKGVVAPMVLMGLGEEDPAFPNEESIRFKNRRCDVGLKTQTKQANTFKQEEVSRWKPGMRIRLDSLEFVGNQAVPNYYSMPVLYKLLEIMLMYPDLAITIQGHVCCGDDMPLSVARAKAVHDYLVGSGIDASRLRYEGFSNTQPVAKEIDEASEQRNRRVELSVQAQPTQTTAGFPDAETTFVVALREVPFKPNTNQLQYTAEYNLSLLAEMIKVSSGYTYVLYVYAPNKSLQQKRFQKLSAYFKQQNVPVDKLKVKPGQDKALANRDVLILEVKPHQ